MLADNTKKTEVWDTKTQAFHGGQEHRFLDNFVEDFSVTTNYLGTPRKALEAAREAVSLYILVRKPGYYETNKRKTSQQQ